MPALSRVLHSAKGHQSWCLCWGSTQVVMPPFQMPFLPKEPGHAVLDVCAAPGSKTLQARRTSAPQ